MGRIRLRVDDRVFLSTTQSINTLCLMLPLFYE